MPPTSASIELLDEKFRLFDGVFGASDEVLGAVESGVDFEKRIAAIYQKCRTPEQIQFEFDQLQRELDTDIVAGQRDAREKLLDNFDQEVVERVRGFKAITCSTASTMNCGSSLVIFWPITRASTRTGIASPFIRIRFQAKRSIPAPIGWARVSRM